MNKVTINEVCNRSKLSEGRSQGMAFAFLLPKSEEVYDTMFAMSPCKDFLNEPLFTENTGCESQAYGLICKKPIGIFNDEYAYIGIQWLKDKYNGYNITKDGYEKAVEQLKNNYHNIQKFLNIIEDKLEFSLKTSIEAANDDRFLIKVPKEWTSSTIMISLYTLLTRASILYDGEKDIIKYLTEYEYITDDKYLIKSMIPRLELILETKKLVPQPPFDEDRAKKGIFSPHNLGILSWNMKYEEELEAHGVD
jgi:hypothetical protein